MDRALADAFPDGIPVSLTGQTTNVRIDYGDIVRRAGEGFAKSKFGDLLGGGKDGDGKKDDPIGGLLDALNKNKKKDKDKKDKD